jgi:hypothetical protein
VKTALITPENGLGFQALVFEFFLVLPGPGLLFASGLRIVQSGGGKEMRQNPGQGFIKSSPTSRFSD